MFNDVKLLNLPVGVVVLFLSGVFKNLGTFCFVLSYRRSSTSFHFLVGKSSLASNASSAFINFCASYISSDKDSSGSFEREKMNSPFLSLAMKAVKVTCSFG